MVGSPKRTVVWEVARSFKIGQEVRYIDQFPTKKRIKDCFRSKKVSTKWMQANYTKSLLLSSMVAVIGSNKGHVTQERCLTENSEKTKPWPTVYIPDTGRYHKPFSSI